MHVLLPVFTGVGDKTSRCPAGSAACRMNNNTVIDMGQTTQKLQFKNGRLTLTYKSNTVPSSCTAKPTTTIEFVCPEAGAVSLLILTLLVDTGYCFYFVMHEIYYVLSHDVILSPTLII